MTDLITAEQARAKIDKAHAEVARLCSEQGAFELLARQQVSRLLFLPCTSRKDQYCQTEQHLLHLLNIIRMPRTSCCTRPLSYASCPFTQVRCTQD